MDTKIINAENAPAAVGPYCHAVEAGDFVFTSGQIGLDPQTQELKEGVAAQTKQVLANLGAVLKASDLTLDNVIKTTVFLADINDFAEINEILRRKHLEITNQQDLVYRQELYQKEH